MQTVHSDKNIFSSHEVPSFADKNASVKYITWDCEWSCILEEKLHKNVTTTFSRNKDSLASIQNQHGVPGRTEQMAPVKPASGEWTVEGVLAWSMWTSCLWSGPLRWGWQKAGKKPDPQLADQPKLRGENNHLRNFTENICPRGSSLEWC